MAFSGVLQTGTETDRGRREVYIRPGQSPNAVCVMGMIGGSAVARSHVGRARASPIKGAKGLLPPRGNGSVRFR